MRRPHRDWLVLPLAPAVYLCLALATQAVLDGCVRLDPVTPVPEPSPAPLEPPPVVEPTAATCERACAHRAELRCPPAYAACVATCDAYEAEARAGATALGWSPECQTAAASCEAADACRGTGAP
jgi:hypothetical protein